MRVLPSLYPRRIAPLSLPLLLVLAASACRREGTSESAGEGSARDSAGIRIVDAPASTEGLPAWSLSAEPIVDIGSAEGDPNAPTFHITDALRLPDGRIVVVNQGTQDLRYFDADGRWLATAGGKGGGPGEFEGLYRAVHGDGDSLLAYDYRSRALSVIGPDASYLSTVRLNLPATAGIAFPVARLSDGSILARTTTVWGMEGSPTEGLKRDTVALVRFRPDGKLTDTVLTTRGNEQYVASVDNSFMVTSAPFGAELLVAAGGKTVYLAQSERWEVRSYDPSGKLVRILRRSVEPARRTDAMKRALLERELESARGDFAKVLEKVFPEMPFPDRLPALGELSVDRAGDLWVADYAPPTADSTHWTIFGPGGRPAARLAVPTGLTFYEIGPDWVLAAQQDELSAPDVQLYGLRRGSAAGQTRSGVPNR